MAGDSIHRHAAAKAGRVARRRERVRAALLAAAARQFAARGVNAVSVEELLAEADVSRATFYAMFTSKFSLLEGLVKPVLEEARAAVEALSDLPPAAAVEGLVAAYWGLWRSHRDGLLLCGSPDPGVLERFRGEHDALQAAMLDVLARAERAELLRNGSAHYSLKVIVRAAIPLLLVYEGHPAAEQLFSDALRGLLLRTH
ncbi:MAG TPA: TetR/AcrR family transcriptional regulator [Gammaproteobacteria bacterium]